MATTTGVTVADPLSRNYKVLKPHERFTLTLEAMARGDEVEADRLEDTCPRLNYNLEDREYRDRMHRAYLITLMAWGNLQKMMAVIRTSTIFKDQHKLYAEGPTMVARSAFLFGRQYALWEAGLIEQIDLPDFEELKAEIRERPDLKEQLRELRECAELSVLKVAEAVQESIGIGVGEEALSQWEGFSRFCRRSLGVEPLTLLAAYGVRTEDPAAEVLAIYPDVKADEAKAEERAGHWAGEWERRFGGGR
jgi:hypothetical protein